MTARVADETDKQIQVAAAAGSGGLLQQLQLRQTKLRMISLQCYGGSWELSTADVAHMARLMVLINHGQLFFDDAHFEDPKLERYWLQRMLARCQRVTAARCDDLLQVWSTASFTNTAGMRFQLP
jgi:hypothetical protein